MDERRFIGLGFALLVVGAAFLFWSLRAPYRFILELRVAKLLALICVRAAIGAATVLFQTVAMNRLLTPGIVGFDALFILFQTFLVAALGGVGSAQIPGVALRARVPGSHGGGDIALWHGLAAGPGRCHADDPDRQP
jgi:iron complex transport system permease protein